MSEVKELLDSSEERLSTARILLENERYEDAISRIYYSMFNAAKALLLTEDSSPKTHQGVQSELGKLFRDSMDKELLREFSRIQEMREDADYGVGIEMKKETVEEKFDVAERFLEEAKKII